MVKKSPTAMWRPPRSRSISTATAVPVDDERSRRRPHVVALEEGVAVEAADRLTSVEGAGVGDELGVLGEAGGDGVGVVGGDAGEVGVGDAAGAVIRVVSRGGLEPGGARVLASPPGGARRRSGWASVIDTDPRSTHP